MIEEFEIIVPKLPGPRSHSRTGSETFNTPSARLAAKPLRRHNKSHMSTIIKSQMSLQEVCESLNT